MNAIAYRYHPNWERIRDANKFDKLYDFGSNLPKMREIADKHLNEKELTRNRVLAAMFKIMDKTRVRVGNKIYAERNDTYGLTTLRKKHIVEDDSDNIIIKFKGKNSTEWNISLSDKRLVKTVHECEEIAGYELFKYIDDDGNKHQINSEDYNSYLREISGHDFTAKDFRTWAACKESYAELISTPVPETKRDQQIEYNKVIKKIAKKPGHTPTVCKNSYISPNIENAWLGGRLIEANYSDENFLKWWKEEGLKSLS